VYTQHVDFRIVLSSMELVWLGLRYVTSEMYQPPMIQDRQTLEENTRVSAWVCGWVTE
jgi:hypothetical protein